MGKGTVKQIGVYAVKNDISYALHCACLNEYFSELEPVFNKVIESTKF